MTDSYDLTPEGFQDEYQSAKLIEHKDEELCLRIAGSDFHPDETFYMGLPGEYGSKNIEDVINFAFPEDMEERTRIRNEELDTDNDPDLPEKYDHFSNLVDEYRKGNNVLDLSVNLGPKNISWEDKVDDQATVSYFAEEDDQFKALHLIVDEYDVPFSEYEDTQDVANDKKQCMGLFVHYMVSNHGLDGVTKAQYHGEVKDALDWCERENLVVIKQDKENTDFMNIEMTNQGEKQIKDLADEEAYYADNYAVFQSVYVDDEYVDFESRDGLDLRVPAMRYDELNPYRAVMVINLFTGAFDNVAENWEKEIRSPQFFGRYLGYAAQKELEITESEFERVMEEGKALNDDGEEVVERTTIIEEDDGW